MKRFLHLLFQFFKSLHFINLLLLLIALFSAFGTFPDSVKFFSYPFGKIYSNPWFLFLLGLLALLAACYVFGKVSKILKSFERHQIQKLSPPVTKFSFHLPVSFTSFSNASGEVLKLITAKGFKSLEEKKPENYSIYASKNKWGMWGAPSLHAGLVFVLIGGLLTFLFADIKDVMIPEGEILTIPHLSERVRLDKFLVVLHAGESTPDEYVSHLLLEKKNGKLERRELKVNHPVQIGFTKLFQMRYRVELLRLDLNVFHNGQFIERLPLKVGESKALSHHPFFVRVEEVIPDFAMDKQGKVTNRSPYFQNPAALIAMHAMSTDVSVIPAKAGIHEPRSPIKTFGDDKTYIKSWAFQDFVSHMGKKKEGEWSFVIDKIKKRYISGIKLSFDPGVPLAYVGFVLLILGAFISSFVIPSEFFISFSAAAGGDGTQMEIQDFKTKDRFGFQKELQNLSQTLSNILLKEKK